MDLDPSEILRRAKLVANEFGGIQPTYEVFYIFSIFYCAERANAAFLNFENQCESGDALLLTSLIHEALGHAATLSRFFWPIKNTGAGPARATRLRTAFAVDDDSPLKDRSLRNSLEHFDERLDAYLLVNDAGHFFPAPMLGSHELADETVAHIFKLIDPDNEFIVILGEKCYFAPIRSEVERILKTVSPMVEIGRFHHPKEV